MENLLAEDKKWVFSFDLKEESDVACLTEKGRVQFRVSDQLVAWHLTASEV